MRLESQQTMANDVPLSDVNKTISLTILRRRSRYGLIMSFVFRCPAYYVRRHVIISASLVRHATFIYRLFVRSSRCSKKDGGAQKQTLLSLTTQVLLLPKPKPLFGTTLQLLFCRKSRFVRFNLPPKRIGRCVCLLFV